MRRRFTRPEHLDSAETPSFGAQLARKKRRRGLIWAGSALALLIVVASTAVLSLNRDPIPTAVRNSVPFAIYFPAKVPAGYSLQKASIKSTNGVVRYNLNSESKSPTVAISQQPLPTNFNPQIMFEHSNIPTTVSPLGTVYDLSFKTQSRYMIVASSSLIFITSTPTISNSQLESIVNGLAQGPK